MISWSDMSPALSAALRITWLDTLTAMRLALAQAADTGNLHLVRLQFELLSLLRQGTRIF